MTSVKAPKTVDVKPLREAFVRSNMRLVDVAVELGWERANGKSDGDRVARVLGLKRYYSGTDRRYRTIRRCHYKNAVKLAHVLNVDPVDLDI